MKHENCSVMSNSLQTHELYSPWNSLGQNTGVGSLSFLQGIFPTQGLNPGLPNCKQILYQLRYKNYNFNNSSKKSQFKNQQRTWKNIIPNMIYKWQTYENTHNHAKSLPERYKLKVQWNITSKPLRQMLLNKTKMKQILVGRWKSWNPCSNPDDEIVKWYNCYGKQYESTSKNKK